MQILGVVVCADDVARAGQCLHVNGANGGRFGIRNVQLNMILADEANCEAVGLSPLAALYFRLVVEVALFAVTAEVKSAICLQVQSPDLVCTSLRKDERIPIDCYNVLWG